MQTIGCDSSYNGYPTIQRGKKTYIESKWFDEWIPPFLKNDRDKKCWPIFDTSNQAPYLLHFKKIKIYIPFSVMQIHTNNIR